MKIILTTLVCLLAFTTAFADANASSSGSASQTIQLVLSPAIEFQANNNIQINTTGNTYTVRSNSHFNITASSADAGQDANGTQQLVRASKNGEETFAMNYKTKNNKHLVYTATQP